MIYLKEAGGAFYHNGYHYTKGIDKYYRRKVRPEEGEKDPPPREQVSKKDWEAARAEYNRQMPRSNKPLGRFNRDPRFIGYMKRRCYEFPEDRKDDEEEEEIKKPEVKVVKDTKGGNSENEQLELNLDDLLNK